jgi:hypothetical protein
MTSIYCPRLPRKIRWDARASMEASMARLQIRDRVVRLRELARTLNASEVGSLLFFLAAIFGTFVI